jgi:glycosyltransferase involved in cell wall biosynthesis
MEPFVADFQGDVDPQVNLDHDRRERAVREALGGVRWEEFRFVNLSGNRFSRRLSSIRFIPFDLRFLNALARCDVVWFLYSGNGPGSLPLIMIGALLAGRKPFVISIHISPEMSEGRSLYLRFFHRIGLLKAVHVLKQTDLDVVEKGLGIPATLIPNGVDCERFTPGTGAKTGFRVLFVGALDKKKGVDLLPTIYSKLKGSSLADDLQLVIVSSGGKLTEEIEEWSRGKDDVVFGGLATGDDLVNLYRSAAVLLFPSRTETFGLVPLEAQACGTPVVMWRGVCFNDCVKHEETGFVTERHDSDSFVDAIIRLYGVWRSDEGYEEMCKDARQNVVDNFSLDRVVAQVAGLITSSEN